MLTCLCRRWPGGGRLGGLDDLRHGELSLDPGQDGDWGGAGEGREELRPQGQHQGEPGQQLDPATPQSEHREHFIILRGESYFMLTLLGTIKHREMIIDVLVMN